MHITKVVVPILERYYVWVNIPINKFQQRNFQLKPNPTKKATP